MTATAQLTLTGEQNLVLTLPSNDPVTLDLSRLYAADGTARLARLDAYAAAAREAVPAGADATLTGPAPVWLYLRVAHALHGRARKLSYTSPVSGPVTIFDHTP